MNQYQAKQLEKYYLKLCKDNFIEPDVFDFQKEGIDMALTLNENKNILNEKLSPLIKIENKIQEHKLEEKRLIEEQTKERISFEEKWLSDTNPLQEKYLKNFKTIAVYGDMGTGKTALAYSILNTLKGKPVFFIRHPNPELIKELGYANIRSIEQMETLHDCLIYWDEPQLSTSIYDHKTNTIIARACSLARQRNITLIVSSSDTRVFTKYNESYFDLWLIKDVDYTAVKNGSKIKKAIRDNAILNPDGFKLEINEYLTENRKYVELNGKHTFKLIKEWNDHHSKPYQNPERNRE